MTTIDAVMTALVAALAVSSGTFNLSGADQVQEGVFNGPPGSVSFAAVEPPRQTGSEQQCRNTMYLETVQVSVQLWTPYTAETTTSRVQRGRALANEAKTKLDASRDTLGTALWKCVRFKTDVVEPDRVAANAVPDWATATVRVELTYRRGTQT